MNKKKIGKKVLILLAACNGEKWISKQIETILNQKNVNISLKISIDRSTDKTIEICKKFADGNKNISLEFNSIDNSSAAKNFYRLISKTDFKEYDFIALSDQDDIWLQNKIKYAIDIIEYENVDVYSSDALAFWENEDKKIYIKKSYNQKKYDFYFEAAGPGCTYVLNNKSAIFLQEFILKNYKNLKSISQHDWLIYAILRKKNFKWLINDKALILYRQHKNNVFGANYGLKNLFYRINLLFNKWYKKQIINIIKIVGDEEDQYIFKYFLKNKTIYKFFLLVNVKDLRRRPRDKFIMFFILLFGLI